MSMDASLVSDENYSGQPSSCRLALSIAAVRVSVTASSGRGALKGSQDRETKHPLPRVRRELSDEGHVPVELVERIEHLECRVQVGSECPERCATSLGSSSPSRVSGDAEQVQFCEVITDAIERALVRIQCPTHSFIRSVDVPRSGWRILSRGKNDKRDECQVVLERDSSCCA
jgi:hypothetical protein